MPLGKEGDYAYAYGVICGKYSKLFNHRVMENFIEARGISEIAASLEGTEYEKELQNVMGKRISPRSLEIVLRKSFIRVYDEIVAAIPVKDRYLLDAIIPEELNIRNLKITMRVIHSNMPPERITQLMEPSKNTDTELIRVLSESENIEDFISRLEGTRYHEVLSREFKVYQELDDLLPLEIALDKLLVDRWSKLMTKHKELQDFVKLKIDLINIRNILRCKVYNIPCRDYILGEGQYLSRSELDLMINAEIGNMADILKHTPYAAAVGESLAYYEKTGSLMHLETSLEKMVRALIEGYSISKPLSIGSVISFLSMKESEIKNLRSIIICKSYDISPKEIKELMS